MDDHTDAAPFDRVEALARSLCRMAGRDWDAKHAKRNHWRKRALRVLEAEQAKPSGLWARLAAFLRRVLR